MERILSYVEAIREATDQEMARDPAVLVFGLDVDDPLAIQGTTKGLPQKYGAEARLRHAVVGRRHDRRRHRHGAGRPAPIHIHIRMDFMMLAMNQIVNCAAKYRYMYGGQRSLPLVIRGMIGKSSGQGAQHSQSLYSFYMHVPGLKVVAPTTPYDAKGCLIAAVRDDNPVIYVEHRILHYQKGPVPEATYEVKPGKARVAVAGSDVTLVGISNMQVECLRAQRGTLPTSASAPRSSTPSGWRRWTSTRSSPRRERPAACASSTTTGRPAARARKSWPKTAQRPPAWP